MEAVLQGPSGRITLGSAVLTIGRTAGNQLVVNDIRASSHHAEIRNSWQGYSIIDLGSTNGTFINDQRLEPNVPRPLTAGDRIRIGDTLFFYEVTNATEVGQYDPTVAAGSSDAHTAYGEDMQQLYAPPPPPMYGQPAAPSYPPSPYVQPTAPSYPPPSYAQSPYKPVPQPAPPPKPRNLPRILIIALVILVLVGGGVGTAAYLLTRPHPVISVTSQYHVGSTPADSSTGTGFHISGQKFSSNSAITFLLDGTPVPGNATVQSDANGNISADLTVTDAWSQGNHTLTARDAGNYTTQSGVAVEIVQPGVANTPGPNGAPPDAMSFNLAITIQHHDVNNNQTFTPLQETLTITGQPDPTGGSVCRSTDNGQPQTFNGTLNGGSISYQETYVETCSGTYKGGKLSYTQMVTSDQFNLSNGQTCTVSSPYTYEQLQGNFTAANSISGNYSLGAVKANCADGSTVTFDAESGTWSGQIQ